MALTLNGYPITDFSGRDPGLPSVIKNGNPERIALYPLAHDDGGAGTLRDQVTLTNATTAGGSTLLAAAKRRNDYQRLTSDFPSLGYRASPAWTNLLYALNADAPSFEGGTTAGFTTNQCVIANDGTQAWHGSKSLKSTQNTAAGWHTASLDIKTATAAGAQYTATVFVKGTVGGQFRISLFGDTSGITNGATVVATGGWDLVTVTKTFAAGDTTTRTLIIASLTSSNGEYCYWDAISLVAGATVPQFEESECVATSCTFPTAGLFSAGEPVSFLVFVWTPWAGNDGVTHYLLNTRGAGTNDFAVFKLNTNNLMFFIRDAANTTKSASIAVNAVNWPAGSFHAIACSTDASNNQRISLDGSAVAAGAGPGVRESAVGANTYIGLYNTGANPLNGIILPYIYRGVAWGDEECEYYSTLQAPPPRTRMVF